MAVEGNPRKPSVSRRIAQRLASGVTVFDPDPMDGGLAVIQWMQLWQQTHDMGRRTEWPDGKCLLEQPALGVAMLDLVGEQLMKEAQAHSG
jgi:hypothetical protein